MSSMFSTELKFASDCILKWFYQKHMKNNLELSHLKRTRYQTHHPIDWKKDKCQICGLLLKTEIQGIDISEIEMSYFNFNFRKEHVFFRNIYSIEEVNSSENSKKIRKII